MSPSHLHSMILSHEKPELVSFASERAQMAVGGGQCETGFGYNSGNCTTGWMAYKACTSGPWAANGNCTAGANASSTTYRQCCTGATPTISNTACTTGAVAGKSCSLGTDYSQYDCS